MNDALAESCAEFKELSECYDLVRTVQVVMRNGLYRIEIYKNCSKGGPNPLSFKASCYVEREIAREPELTYAWVHLPIPWQDYSDGDAALHETLRDLEQRRDRKL